MEMTEHLLRLSRKAEEKTGELIDLIEQINDVPVRDGRASVFAELLAADYIPEGGSEYGRKAVWSVCHRMDEQREYLARLVHKLRAEAEVLTSIADDAIGKTGRLT